MAPNLAVMATDETEYAGPQVLQGQEGRMSHQRENASRGEGGLRNELPAGPPSQRTLGGP